MEIKVTNKLAQEVRERHVAAQKSISLFANEKEEQGMLFSIYSGMDVAATAFLLAHFELNNKDVKETVDDFLNFVVDQALKHFVEMPHVEKAIKEEMSSDKTMTAVMTMVTEALKDSDVTPIIAGGSLQEIADQMQGMADAEKATKQ